MSTDGDPKTTRETQPDLVLLIADALVVSVFRYPRKRMFLFPLCDYLLLLYQIPCYLTIWIEEKGQGPRLRFSSLADCDHSLIGEILPPVMRDDAITTEAEHTTSISLPNTNTRILLSVRRVSEPVRQVVGNLPADANRIDRLVRVWEENAGLYAPVRQALIDAVMEQEDQPVDWDPERMPRSLCEPLPSNWMLLLDPLKKRLDNYLMELRNNFLGKGSDVGLDLWCSVQHQTLSGETRRVADYHFRFSASLLATRAQEKEIKQLWKDQPTMAARIGALWGPDADPLQIVRWPLADYSVPSNSNSGFQSGSVHFGLRPDNDTEAGATGDLTVNRAIARKELQKVAYQALSKLDMRLCRDFYVPIHVAGTPWLSLHLFSERSNLYYCYQLYRDVIFPGAGLLRMAAKEAWLEVLTDAITTNYRNTTTTVDFVDVLNRHLDEVARVYPFHKVQLLITDNHALDHHRLTMDEQKWQFQLEPNPYFSRQFEPDENETVPVSRLNEILSTASSLNWRRAFVSYSVAHPLKKKLNNLDVSMDILIETLEKDDDVASRVHHNRTLVDQLTWYLAVIHILHYAATESLDAVYGGKESNRTLRFATTKSLNLALQIAHVVRDCSTPEAAIEYEAFTLVPFIDPHYKVEDHSDPVRLQDDFYREILFEILVNTIDHGIVNDGKVQVTFHQDTVLGQPALVISNAAQDPYLLAAPVSVQSVWQPWPTDGPRGLNLVHHALRATNSGLLYYKHTDSDVDTPRQFSVALVLEGLRFASGHRLKGDHS